MTVWAYVRVSKEEQARGHSPAAQEEAIEAHVRALGLGDDVVVVRDLGRSGADPDRPGLRRILREAREGDAVVVWALDRLGRDARLLLEILDRFKERGVALYSVREGVLGEGAAGQLLYSILSAVAEFERERLRERTKEGLRRAKRAGKRLGRPRKHDHDRLRAEAEKLLAEGKTLSETAKILGVPLSSLYYILRIKKGARK